MGKRHYGMAGKCCAFYFRLWINALTLTTRFPFWHFLWDFWRISRLFSSSFCVINLICEEIAAVKATILSIFILYECFIVLFRFVNGLSASPNWIRKSFLTCIAKWLGGHVVLARRRNVSSLVNPTANSKMVSTMATRLFVLK